MKTIYESCIFLEIMDINFEEWKNCLTHGIIDLDTVRSTIMTKKERSVLEMHQYKITQLSDGRYGTYVPDETKTNGRRNLKAPDRITLIDKLYDWYHPRQKPRLHDIFEEWLDYKVRKKRNCEETKKQNRASYIKYVEGTAIDLMELNKIKSIDLEEWAIGVLTTYDMTAKTFNNHKIVVTGPLKYAKRKGYIAENPWNSEELEYHHLFRSPRRRPSAELVFYPDEIEELRQEFERGYQKNGNIANLGLMVNFDLGLRVGELSALKWSDIDWKNETIFIQRQEVANGKVVEQVKSDSAAGYRELDLSDEAISIFKRIRRDSTILSEYIFCNPDGNRATKIQFVHRLTKAEIALGWKEFKYTHCIRRTVASRMDAEGENLEAIRQQLGHTDIATTFKYLKNPFRESETRKRRKATSILATNQACLQLSSKKEPQNCYDKSRKAL